MAVSRCALGTPMSRGTSSATVRIYYEVYGEGEPTFAAADLDADPLALLEDADPVSRAPLPRRHLRRARQRALGPPPRPRTPTATKEFAADALAVMDATGTEQAYTVSLSAGRSGTSGSRPSIASGCWGRLPRADVPDHGGWPNGAGQPLTDRRDQPRGRRTATTSTPEHREQLARLRRVVGRGVRSRAPFHEGDRGRVGWGLETDGAIGDTWSGRTWPRRSETSRPAQAA